RDEIEAGALLVVGPDDVPGRMFGVRRLEHRVARARILVPPFARRQVHGTELPLPERVLDARFEPALLLLVADLEPDLDQLNAAVDDLLFEHRRDTEKPLVLLLGAEAHHALHAGAVVPAPIEDDDFARGGEMLQVPLDVHLALLAVGRRGQRDHAENARAHFFGDGPDGAALPGSVAPFEDDDHALAALLHIVLEHAQLALQA